MENKRRLSRPLMVGHRSHGRCRYDPEVKRELGEAYLQPGVSAALMALEHGINANLMHKWINRHCENVSPAQPSPAQPSPAQPSPAQPSPVAQPYDRPLHRCCQWRHRSQ
ncbi:transposase [Methylomonas sp. MED-D]|uniref:transposase n=2 Tax=unclassified Methylomonas TaxID=2608980 RepID=UPI003CFF24B9